MDNSVGGDIATSARPVLDDERRGKSLRQPLTNEPGAEVAPAASGKPDNQVYRLRVTGCTHYLRSA